MKLKNGNYLIPFWGASDYLSRGRDSLGLQTASLATYARLIPIITNLTSRIRYFGFYCWLLEEYAKKVGDTDPKIQKMYIRRAELLIAFMMVKCRPGLTGIPGVAYASNHVNNDILDLKLGADQEPGKSDTYWALSSGAFGQYYAAAMQMAGFIVHSKNAPEIFIPTEKNGRPLAKSFEENLVPDHRTLFWSSIEHGSCEQSSLELLIKSYSISDIPDGSFEQRIYIDLLRSNDVPIDTDELEYISTDINLTKTYFRRSTAKIILKHINENRDIWSTFKNKIYQQNGDFDLPDVEEVAFGWYYYQLNEYWHYGIETVFWAMLASMDLYPDEYNQVTIQYFIEKFKEGIFNRIIQDITEEASRLTVEEISGIESIQSESEFVESIGRRIAERDPFGAASLGIRMLIKIFKNNQQHLSKLSSYTTRFNISRQGDVIGGLRWMGTVSMAYVKDLVEIIVKRYLINRHIKVAFEKMGSGIKNTLKFSIEHNIISHLETIEPAFTTPRIYSLFQIMRDSGLIDNDNKITERGLNFLNE
jgi:hypothetical protein